MNLELKQAQFHHAMVRYLTMPTYKLIDVSCSVLNLSLQAILLSFILKTPLGIGWAIFALALAYVFADFVNGLVHLAMDHIDFYESFFGPLIAKFHLLLSKEEHAVHHERDNANYCFLNGMTNPVVNRIARKYFPGYKMRTDLHHANYV